MEQLKSRKGHKQLSVKIVRRHQKSLALVDVFECFSDLIKAGSTFRFFTPASIHQLSHPILAGIHRDQRPEWGIEAYPDHLNHV